MEKQKIVKEAYYYEKIDKDNVKCNLCPYNCFISNNSFGKCKVRKNVNGRLTSINYGEISAINIDPIEKKPLRNFIEGTKTLSIGTFGCNFHCEFCQNYTISLNKPKTTFMSPEELIDIAISKNLPSISYTYNEPTIFYEYMYDCAELAANNNLKNIVVTNGYINEKPLVNILPYIDAMNIDLKTYDNNSYNKICGGEVKNVLRTIELASRKCHVEVTMLIVPSLNDNIDEMIKLFKLLYEKSPNIVIHLTRYFPMYKMKEPATPVDLLMKLQREALKYFDRVYLGNV